MEIEEHLKAVLGSLSDDAKVDVGHVPGGRVDALVVSGSFAGVSDRQRQETIWKKLRHELRADELLKVSFVLASTPEEEEALVQWPANKD